MRALSARAGLRLLVASLGAVGLGGTIIGSAMAFIDGTVVNVALPQI